MSSGVMGCGDMSVHVCALACMCVCVSEAEVVENINSLLAELLCCKNSA